MTIDDVVELARQRAEEERRLAIQYEVDGFPMAALPHDVACATYESFARTVSILSTTGEDMDDYR